MSTTTKGKGRQSIWTEEIIQKMLDLWMEGKSASVIAKELCTMAGQQLTRNAVIGKLHRMRKAGQIPEREDSRTSSQPASGHKAAAPSPSPSTAQSPQTPPASVGSLALETKARMVAVPQASAKVELEVVAEEVGLITDIMELTPHTCRWPIGNPGEEGFCYCGHKSQEGRPYCERHAAVAYQR